MVRLKTITVVDAALVMSVLRDCMDFLSPQVKYQALKIQEILEHSIQMAQSCMVVDDAENKWLEEVDSLPFQPLDKSKLFACFDTLKPADFIALKKLCS